MAGFDAQPTSDSYSELMSLFSKTPKPAHEPTDDSSPGWNAITAHFDAAYPGQTDPAHYGTLIKYRLGGPDPLDGVSIYRATEPVPHWHYVTYGYSDLYGENPTDDPDADSGFGIEMTLRLADQAVLDPSATPPVWVVNLLQNLARYVFRSGNVIYASHHLNANGPIALDSGTLLTALAFMDDPIGTPIHTPSGQVRLVQAVGITEQELAHCVAWNTHGVLDVIGTRWPHGLTILDRPGLDSDPALVALIDDGEKRDGSSLASYSVETLQVTPTADGLTAVLSTFAIAPLAKAATARLAHGRDLRVFGTDQTLDLIIEGDAPVRTPGTANDMAIISLTADGLKALADLPSTPGEYCLPQIPGVTWRLVETS